jgi:hypothetical protein
MNKEEYKTYLRQRLYEAEEGNQDMSNMSNMDLANSENGEHHEELKLRAKNSGIMPWFLKMATHREIAQVMDEKAESNRTDKD